MVNTKKMCVVRLLFNFLPLTKAHRIKTLLLRWAGVKIGENCEITSSVKILGNMDLTIGDNVFIGHEAMIMGALHSKIIIGNYVKIGSRTVIVTGTHRFSPDGNCIEKEGTYADIEICDGAAVSTCSIVLPGKKVNKMAHVAAGSVVTKDIPEYCRYGGAPARFIKDLRNI